MSVARDVTGAVMPWVILGGVAVVLYRYRDQILAWITGSSGVPGPGTVLQAAAGAGATVRSWIDQTIVQWQSQYTLLPVAATPEGYLPSSWTWDLGGGISLGIPPGYTPESWCHENPGAPICQQLVQAAAPAAPAGPSALSVALGLTGDPISGYTSVMSPISEPSPVVNPYGYPEGVYYMDGYRLTITPGWYDVSRADPRYAGVGNEGWASILWGTGPAAWYSPTLASWVSRFGL